MGEVRGVRLRPFPVRLQQGELRRTRGFDRGGIGVLTRLRLARRACGREAGGADTRGEQRSARDPRRVVRHRAESFIYPGAETFGETDRRQHNSGRCAVAAVSRDRVRAALLPVVTAAGFDLEDVAVSAAGRRNVIRVIVDRDGGIDLDAVAEVSRVVSDALDATDVTGPAAYTLEVTSPGVDRPLTEPRHWRRAVGRLVVAGATTGRIVDADDENVTLDVNGSEQVVPYADLPAGRVQVEFGRSTDPKSGGAA